MIDKALLFAWGRCIEQKDAVDQYEALKIVLAAYENKKWQPIKTAPRDGTIILVYLPWPHEPYRVRQASYGGQNSNKPDKWYVYFNRSDARYIDMEPTHWQHFPEWPTHEPKL